MKSDNQTADNITKSLTAALFHSCDWITIQQASELASSLREFLFHDESIEDWGIRLHAHQEAAEDVTATLKDQISILLSDCKRHSGNVVEAQARITQCHRSIPTMRACRWVNNEPCACRGAVAAIFSEYHQ
jgi:hypothetical protein